MESASTNTAAGCQGRRCDGMPGPVMRQDARAGAAAGCQSRRHHQAGGITEQAASPSRRNRRRDGRRSKGGRIGAAWGVHILGKLGPQKQKGCGIVAAARSAPDLAGSSTSSGWRAWEHPSPLGEPESVFRLAGPGAPRSANLSSPFERGPKNSPRWRPRIRPRR